MLNFNGPDPNKGRGKNLEFADEPEQTTLVFRISGGAIRIMTFIGQQLKKIRLTRKPLEDIGVGGKITKEF